MVEYHEPLKLGKGSAFVKSKLRHLPQADDVWEVDFQPVPEQVWKQLPRGEPWLGLVVSVPEHLHLANVLLEVPPPTVNDLARLLAHAMNRPLVMPPMASRIASFTPIGRIGNTSRAARSRTTVGFFSPSIRCRPTSKLAGVTRASQRPDSHGVRTGTEISHRRSPFCRAYSRIRSP